MDAVVNKPDRSAYQAIDFVAWKNNGQLSISPRFQRRKVWSRAAKSFLIDTLILGFPVPPIYIRIVKKKGSKVPVREIIDGQQRITSIIEYIEGDFALSTNLYSPSAGKKFDELSSQEQDKITEYSLICEVFQGISDENVLSIFARLNTYSVRLNGQELRNGKYFGGFKQSAYGLAYSHLTFWRNNGIFTETAIARMREVELTSELIIALVAGMQDKKKSIDDFYARYDEEFSERRVLEKNFKRVIDEINEIFPEGLGRSEFRRTPLFYSMFLALAHRLFGVPSVSADRSQISSLSVPERKKFRETVENLSAAVKAARNGDEIGGHNSVFVKASLSQTDNIRPRRQRLNGIYSRAFG